MRKAIDLNRLSPEEFAQYLKMSAKNQEDLMLIAGQIMAGVGMGLLYAAGKVLETTKKGKK